MYVKSTRKKHRYKKCFIEACSCTDTERDCQARLILYKYKSMEEVLKKIVLQIFKVLEYSRVVGRPLSLPCPLHHCNGEQVLEHYNMTTLKYDIIDDGPHHLIGYNDEGSHRCWQRCNITDRQYCYFIVQGNGAQYRFPYKVLCYYYSNTSDGRSKDQVPSSSS